MDIQHTSEPDLAPSPVRLLPSDPIVVHDTQGSVAILHVFDEVDIATAGVLEGELRLSLEAPSAILDLSECRYIDSSVLAVLVRANRRFPGRLRVVARNDSNIQNVLRITAVDKFIPSFGTLEEALAG